jgi:hypothetical protein
MKKLYILVASALVGSLLLGAPVRALAQNDPRDVVIGSLQLDQADIRDALKILFRAAGNISYSIDSNVQGTITCDLKQVPFETALRSILGQVQATYRVEGGIYYIVPKEIDRPTGDSGDVATPVKQENPTRRLHIRHADPALIFTLLSQNFRTDTTLQPEISTLVGGGFGGGFGGGGFGGGGFGGGGFGGGGFGGGGLGGGGLGGGGFGGGGLGGFGGGGGFGRGGGGFGGGRGGGF